METAVKGRDVFRNILNLRSKTEEQVLSQGKRAAKAKAALDFLYRQPFVDAITLARELGISRSTAHTLIKEFAGMGILTETTGQQRGRIFSFDNYLKLFMD
jgi:DNA-binding MarR family transcriptional regulator